MQTGVTVANGKIKGTLTKLTSGQLVTDWGEGYFLSLAFDDFASGLTYADCKVGLTPSVSSGLVTLDSDKLAVFKITDKISQKLTVIQKKSGKMKTQYFYLDELVLSEEA